MRNYAIARLKHSGQIGTDKQGTDQNGFPTNEFIAAFQVWYGNYQTNYETAANLETEKIARLITVRHNPKIQARMMFKDHKGREYIISGVQEDDSLNGFDILTLSDANDTDNSDDDN